MTISYTYLPSLREDVSDGDNDITISPAVGLGAVTVKLVEVLLEECFLSCAA